MKKLLFLLIIVVATSFTLRAQYYSRVKPTLVVWQANDQRISLKRGLYGVPKPTTLSINLYFNPEQAKSLANRGVVLQVRWYYYLSTRRKLVKVENLSFAKGHLNPDGSFSLSSSLRTVQPGWWEVQVVSSLDRRYIQFAGLDRFQILIKPRSYTMR